MLLVVVQFGIRQGVHCVVSGVVNIVVVFGVVNIVVVLVIVIGLVQYLFEIVQCHPDVGMLEVEIDFEIGIHGPFEPHSGRSQLGHRRSAVRHAEASGHWCRALAVRLIAIRCY